MKIHHVGAELLPANRRTEKLTWRSQQVKKKQFLYWPGQGPEVSRRFKLSDFKAIGT